MNNDLFAVAAIVPVMPILIRIIQNTLAPALFTPELPAPQAKLVYNTFTGLIHLPTFFGALGAALILEGLLHRINSRRHHQMAVPVLFIPFGIGIFLGWPLSFVIALGGAIRAWVERSQSAWVRSGVVLAAGIMGGEGIVGFITATAATTEWISLTWFRLSGIGLLTLAVLVVLLKRRVP